MPGAGSDPARRATRRTVRAAPARHTALHASARRPLANWPGTPGRARSRRSAGARITRFGAAQPATKGDRIRVQIGGSRSTSRSRCVINPRRRPVPPGGYGRQSESRQLVRVTGRRPAMQAATMQAACRSRLPRARSCLIVVRGSAWQAASCTSRSGNPASSAAVMNVCRSVKRSEPDSCRVSELVASTGRTPQTSSIGDSWRHGATT